jgi:hypothetical protein
MTADRVRLPRRLLWASCALALGVVTLAGCNTSNLITYGTGVVTMNDPGGDRDFTSYIVNVDTITLTRNDGLVIEPLSSPETVDLTKIHDLAELVEAPAIPIGTYTSLSLILDYTAAIITVPVNGEVIAATPVDNTGAAMLQVTLTVNFDPANPLVINSQECTRLALDFNLAAFNSIDLSTSPPTVMVVPFMTATPAPEDSTVMRARGLLVVVQPSDGNYIVNVRPFIDVFTALGALTVNTSATTYFNINGTAYTGAAGLAAMQSLPVSTAVAAYGTLGSFATITPTFNATEVYAGSSLESPLADYVTGTVSAVSGDTLTVKGGYYVPRTGFATPAYVQTVPVTMGPATIVSEDGVAVSGLSTRSISVGQLINVSGVSTLTSVGGLASLDAAQGQVRLQPTELWGNFASATPGTMSLSLLSLGGFEPAVLDFAGTGTDSANDAVAASYTVNTGALNESGVGAGTLLEASGIVTPFGSAPPDFRATVVSDGTATPQQLVVEWENAGASVPFSSLSSAGLVLLLSNPNLSSTIRYISTGPTKTDITTLPASLTIAFASGTPLTLAIGNNGTISVYNSAGAFATALKSTLNGTAATYRLACVGQYSSATNTFTASQVAVNLVP